MKKYLALVATLIMVAFAAPVFAATNPFMDVPLNHWSYDAIGQLAAQGILSGYPDGTYKGKQPTTRYEMASALARALAVVDMTKASKQDVEMLKRLVVEFKDELDALGVRVDQLDASVAILNERLGGWQITGALRLDIDDWDDAADSYRDGDMLRGRSRLFLDRWFGEDESMHFHGRINYEGGVASFQYFYVDIPVWFDSMLTVGRFQWDFEGAYRWGTGGATDIANDSWLTDRNLDAAMGFKKNFGLGGFQMQLARPELPFGAYNSTTGAYDTLEERDAWELTAMANLQFSEQFGFDLGMQVFGGDDYTEWNNNFRFNSLASVFAGLRFDFNPNIALKGIYYYQTADTESSTDGGVNWYDDDNDDTSAFKAIVDIKQDLLGFSSLWLAYEQLDAGFIVPYGVKTLFLVDSDNWHGFNTAVVEHDLNIWRIGATQQWNDQWRSWVYIASHTYADFYTPTNAGYWDDLSAMQYGLGVEFRYNPNVTFALSYLKMDWDSDTVNNADLPAWDNHRIQFRTQVTF